MEEKNIEIVKPVRLLRTFARTYFDLFYEGMIDAESLYKLIRGLRKKVMQTEKCQEEWQVS